MGKEVGLPENSYTIMKLELASLQSVRDFVANLKAFKSARPLTHLICNAAVYRPTDPEPAWTDDGFEMSMGVNHLGHFLLVNLLLDDMSRAKGARVCIVGSITGNTNTWRRSCLPQSRSWKFRRIQRRSLNQWQWLTENLSLGQKHTRIPRFAT